LKNRFVFNKILDDLYLIRQIDLDTKYFESIWEIPEGVVYNSYVLNTSNGSIVFDTVKKNYCSEYIEFLDKNINLKNVKYIVSHHGEPDHSGCVKELSDETNAVVIGHPILGRELSSFYNLTRFKPVNDGESLKIGEYTLVFHYLPWLHWPETIVSHIVEKNVLLTCDIFGSYGVYFNEIYFDELSVEKQREYLIRARKYFANIIGYYREWVLKNIEKTSSIGLKPEIALPAHGLAYRGDSIDLIKEYYLKWSRGEVIDKKIVIVYTSMYRFVEETVNDLASILGENGFKPIVFGFNDTYRSSISDIIGELIDCETIVLATSSYDSSVFPIAKLVAELIVKKIPRNKNIVVLGAYGWGYRVSRELSDIFVKNGFNVKTFDYQAGQHKSIIREIFDKITGSS